MMPKLIRRLFPALSLLMTASASHAAWVTPYLPGSASDQDLKFASITGLVTVDNPPVVAEGYSYRNSGYSNENWSVIFSVIGAVGYYSESVMLASFKTQTVIENGLHVNAVVSGDPSLLSGASLQARWRGAIDFHESPGWETQGSTSFRYVFDIQLNSLFLQESWAPMLDGITLYFYTPDERKTVGLRNILGVPSIDQTTYTGAVVEFDYDPALGESLYLEWWFPMALSGDLLETLLTGTTSLFTVTNGKIEVEIIPEPATCGLIVAAGAAFALSLHRRNRRNGR